MRTQDKAGWHNRAGYKELVQRNTSAGLAAEVVVDRGHSVQCQEEARKPESDMWSPCVIGERQDVDQSGSCCGKSRLDSQTLAHLAGDRMESAGARDCRPAVCSREKESSTHSSVRVMKGYMMCSSWYFRCMQKSGYRSQLEAKRWPKSSLSLQSVVMRTGNRTTIRRPGLECGPGISTVAPALRLLLVMDVSPRAIYCQKLSTLDRDYGRAFESMTGNAEALQDLWVKARFVPWAVCSERRL